MIVEWAELHFGLLAVGGGTSVTRRGAAGVMSIWARARRGTMRNFDDDTSEKPLLAAHLPFFGRAGM
jgi:hypothetical protein